MSESPFVTTSEGARLANRHPVTIRRALESGELHGHQRAHGGRWQIHTGSLFAWVRGKAGTSGPCCPNVRLIGRSGVRRGSLSSVSER
ncbi:helix-turn-helix domain-containing protein [Saccharopolyspora sp. 5N102]|uniref:helix-turn-helix domain-containing protein n=1 Tax=Saccharopolyspora sp. 5N102 TaxID=3375155 RepID=UPI0037B82826